ncbi:DUF1844 domain-containing protein [bacterium]|nr:MAG: DUF1844 domain-containing protein [bacterium]
MIMTAGNSGAMRITWGKIVHVFRRLRAHNAVKSRRRDRAMAQEAPVQNEAVEEAGPTSVYDLVAAFAEPTIELAWQKMGLRPDLRTGRIEADYPQAKVAIDLAAHLAEILTPQLDDEDRRQMANVVRDLRLNYISRTGGGS